MLSPRGGTQYKSGYRDVPQTWVAKSGRQAHHWVPFFSKTWYFDGSIFQNFLKFASKWLKFGTLIGQLFKIFRNLRQNGANFREKILIFGTWMGHFSFKMGTWMGGISKIPAAHPYPDKSWVPPPGLSPGRPASSAVVIAVMLYCLVMDNLIWHHRFWWRQRRTSTCNLHNTTSQL